MKLIVGADPEFMAVYRKDYIYPILFDKNTNLPNGKARSRVLDALRKLPYDEFGHCAEIRPKPAENGRQLILNIAEEMMSLPTVFTYVTPNVIKIDKELVVKMIRKVGRKDISQAENIYGKDVLSSCKADVAAMAENKSLLFCGCHMHISATKEVTITEDGKNYSGKNNVNLPMKSLTWLFDSLIFSCFNEDSGFNIGRYRDVGFYEPKVHGGFEYRSLGSSVLTPRRIELIADLMITITKQFVENQDNFFRMPEKEILSHFRKLIGEQLKVLCKTKPITGNIQKHWSI